MTSEGWLQIALFTLLVAICVRPFGGYMMRVFGGQRTVLGYLQRPLERAIYRIAGIDPAAEQQWHRYALSLLAFNLAGLAALYALQRLQGTLPFNPQQMATVDPVLALNTAISFASNTSWQSYGGETTLSYLSQMAGITVQSYLSAATGIAVAMALIRGFARPRFATVGNFWVDMTRAVLYVLLPISIIGAALLIWQGVPQTLGGTVGAATLDGAQQLIARGPVASQEAIKLMSGDGGGFFNVNSAHPFENPTAVANLVEMVLIFVIGAALTNTFGRMIGNESHGWALLAAMAVLYCRRRRRDSMRPRRAAIPPSRHLRSTSSRATCRPAAIWRARRSASGRRCRRYLRRWPPIHRMALSTRCSTVSRRSAAA